VRLPALLGALLAAVPGVADEAPDGRYRAVIDELVATWPALDRTGPVTPGLSLTCLDTPGEPRLVGARQEMVIQAGLAAVTAILDDVDRYAELYPDVVAVSVVAGSRSGSRYLTTWERRVPLFFIPNTRFSLMNDVDRSVPERVVYRYWLQARGRLTQSDGVVILEALAPDQVRFVEYDFFEAGWGPLPVGVIWTKSLRGLFMSDQSLRLKAEHAAWSYREIHAEAIRLWELDGPLVARCRGASRPAALR